MMRRPRTSDLEIVLIFTLLATVTALLPVDIPVLRVALALPLALFIPGYALSAAIFPKDTLGSPERVVLALGLSLVTLVLGGIVLNFLFVGLQTESWLFLLYGFTLATAIVACIRRYRVAKPTDGIAVPILPLARVILIIGAAGITVLALFVSYSGVMLQPTPGFTQLWIQPDQDGGTNTAQIGLRNAEHRTEEYRLEVVVNNTIIERWPSIVLHDGERWDARVEVPQEAAASYPVHANLYLLEFPNEVYRHVSLWLTPEGS